MNYNGTGRRTGSSTHRNIAILLRAVDPQPAGLLRDNNGITRFRRPDALRPGLARPEDHRRRRQARRLHGQVVLLLKGALKLTRTEKDIDYQFLDDAPKWPTEPHGRGQGSRSRARPWSGRAMSSPRRPACRSSSCTRPATPRFWIDGQPKIDRWRRQLEPVVPQFHRPDEGRNEAQACGSSGIPTRAISPCCTTTRSRPPSRSR
ncbi:hypothetical protein ACRAWD_31315 [Caulobacter segnis]